jgi:hypothetical protein
LGAAKAHTASRRAAPKPSTVSPAQAATGISQNARVLLAALAGAIGSAWIVSIFLRGRALLVPLVARKELAW